MMKNQKTISLEQAIDLLVLNVGSLGNLGLYHGQMGFVLFFCQYAKCCNNPLYDDFAGELLEGLGKALYAELPFSLEDGLCGVGWGVEYLIQNNFMEGDSDELLQEIDERIMLHDPTRIKNLSMRKGLAGLIYYVTIRLSAPRKNRRHPFDEVYLGKLREVVLKQDFSQEKEIPFGLVNNFLSALERNCRVAPTVSDLFPVMKLSCIDIERLLVDGIEIAWGLLEDQETLSNPLITYTKGKDSQKKRLYLFCRESPSTDYGIGTYIRQVIEAMKGKDWEVTVITLYSTQTTVWSEESIDGVDYITIGKKIVYKYKRLKASLLKMQDTIDYDRSVLLLLQNRLIDSPHSVFLLNQMDMGNLVTDLKSVCPHVTFIGVVHYMNWCFTLNGNQSLFQETLLHPEKGKNGEIIAGFEKEKNFLQVCDKVIT